MLYLTGAIWAGYAVCAKRYHDPDKSGWHSALIFVPLVGPLWTIWMFDELGFLRGSPGINRFGEPTAENQGHG